MKPLFLKTILIIILFFIFNCRGQTADDYINFYNDVAPKLNSIIPNKTQFYNQPFSSFSNELQAKNINIALIGCDTKDDLDPKLYVLRLLFNNVSMWDVASNNSFQFPSVSITFENEIPQEVKDMVRQYQGQWNQNFLQFFANMKIKSIRFIGMNGYNSTDNSVK